MADLRQIERASVQEHEPESSLGAPTWYMLPANNALDEVPLPEWGLHSRDRKLRELYRNQYNWLAQGAVANVVAEGAGVPWKLRGGKNLSSYFQSVLQEGNFGEGWADFLSKVLLDYLTCDYGAYIEIIGGGRPDGPLRGRVLGIAHLDSLRCVPTGNLEYPVVYWSRRTGKLHRIHHTRIIRLVDMPDGDETHFGAGLCALSRAIAMVDQQMKMMKFIAGQLGDTPANGVLFLKGITAKNYNQAMQEYKLRRESQGFKGPVAIGSESSEEISGTYQPFAMAPEGFDQQVYIEIHVRAFALAFGVDPQDLWPLQGRMAGTATQSEVLAEKARGKMQGMIRSRLKRAINTKILPPSLEFDFEFRDEEKDKQVAERTGVLLNNAATLRSLGATDETVMRYLTAQDENLRDVLTDEDGEIIALPDDDVLDDAQTDTDITETDAGNQTAPDADVMTGDEKDISDTQTDFMQRFSSVLSSARDGDINRRRAGILFRGMIRTFGGRAYADGLEDGGVPRTEMTDNDNTAVSRLVVAQSQYVSNLTDVIFNQDGVTDAQAAGKARMWFNKSIAPFFDAGRMSADANGMYEWMLGNTEHCADCLKLAGQVHRLKAYINSGWMPRASKLECQGYNCECILIKRPGAKARGRLPSSAGARAHRHLEAA